jgi:uncharacterized membrane protein YhaH (DUF805 family)
MKINLTTGLCSQTKNTQSKDELINNKHYTTADKLLSPKGRIGGMSFFSYSFVYGIVGGLLGGILGALIFVSQEAVTYIPLIITIILFTIAALFVIYMSACLWIRRCHDIGLSGWWAILGFIPYINLLMGLFLIFKKGQQRDNIYGPMPV